MGLFGNNQKKCPICSKPTPRNSPAKIDGMPICQECNSKIDLPQGMTKQMSLESFRQYIDFYNKNQVLRNSFFETYRFDLGSSSGSILLDTDHRLFRLNANGNSLVMEASNLKAFYILEDNVPLFEGEGGVLKCHQSDIPERVNKMAPQITQFRMQRQMYEQMERLQEQRERSQDDEGETLQYNSSEPDFAIPAPFSHFFIELNLTHPYLDGFRGKMDAPGFSRHDPSIDAYLLSYQEEVDKLHTFAVNLIRLMDPNAREIRGAVNSSATARTVD